MLKASDPQIVLGGALSSKQRITIPLFFTFIALPVLFLMQGQPSAKGAILFVAAVLLLVVLVIGVLLSTLPTRQKVSKLLGSPQEISTIGEKGNRITIGLKSGERLEFDVMNGPLFKFRAPDVAQALHRIAPHAIRN